MSVGLDLGTYGMRSLWLQDDHLRARQSRTVYSTLPDRPEQRRLLEQAQISYATCEGALVLIGEAAGEFARLFQATALPLLPGGAVPREDPLARQILATQVEQLLPPAEADETPCCWTFPGASRSRSPQAEETQAFISRLLRLRGYRPIEIPSGMAVVFAELVPEAFTGMGLTVGAAGCEFSLAHQGTELFSCSVPRGGNWVDEQLAARLNLACWDGRGQRLPDLAQAESRKLSLAGTLVHPRDDHDALVCEVYREMLTHVFQEAARELARASGLRRSNRPFSLVCCGGSTHAAGFAELALRQLRQVAFPVEIGDLRVVAASPYTVARGCLINAHLEARSQLQAVA